MRESHTPHHTTQQRTRHHNSLAQRNTAHTRKQTRRGESMCREVTIATRGSRLAGVGVCASSASSRSSDDGFRFEDEEGNPREGKETKEKRGGARERGVCRVRGVCGGLPPAFQQQAHRVGCNMERPLIFRVCRACLSHNQTNLPRLMVRR